MAPDLRRRLAVLMILIFPTTIWFFTAIYASGLALSHVSWPRVVYLARITPQHPVLYGSLIVGLVLTLLLIILMNRRYKTEGYDGAGFKRFIRGTRVVSAKRLKRMCREPGAKQVDVAGIPMPTKVESLHLMLGGATGSGKSVLMRNLIHSAHQRGDRMIVVDPNGDMLSKFYKEGDIILNPYDKRTEGWSFFNEVRSDYDWKRLSRSLVPLAQDKNAEEWNDFGRLLLRETAKKLYFMGKGNIQELFNWCTIVPAEDLRKFLTGTLAESLFVGSSEASKALSSARFVLSNKLSEHMSMPDGEFSIRDFMYEKQVGNIFINWREDMAPAMRPLVSAWVDVFLTSILSMTESRDRRWWLFIDELASMEALHSLEDGLTKGRKHGLRVVAGLQSTSQLASIYGDKPAQTIRASFRNLVVLGGSKTDPQTAEDMSKSLGEHEVERKEYTTSRSTGSRSTNDRATRTTERVVSPSQIQGFPDLTGYVAFASDLPIAKVLLQPRNFTPVCPAFVESSALKRVSRTSDTAKLKTAEDGPKEKPEPEKKPDEDRQAQLWQEPVA